MSWANINYRNKSFCSHFHHPRILESSSSSPSVQCCQKNAREKPWKASPFLKKEKLWKSCSLPPLHTLHFSRGSTQQQISRNSFYPPDEKVFHFISWPFYPILFFLSGRGSVAGHRDGIMSNLKDFFCIFLANFVKGPDFPGKVAALIDCDKIVRITMIAQLVRKSWGRFKSNSANRANP